MVTFGFSFRSEQEYQAVVLSRALFVASGAIHLTDVIVFPLVFGHDVAMSFFASFRLRRVGIEIISGVEV